MKELNVVSSCSCGCDTESNVEVEESCCGSDCNCDEELKKSDEKIIIDFLYLDLDECTRCQGTDQNLEGAVLEVKNVLKSAGKAVEVNKVNIISEELAKKYHFLSSPTIRVNGVDIQEEVTEDNCESCGDLCGDEIDCRTWNFKGNTYTEPPKSLIVEGILSKVYGKYESQKVKNDYEVPENLKNFFEGIKKKS